MAKISAGLLMFRHRPGGAEVLLVHPGGPFWRNKDAGAWSIPKGESSQQEDLFATARREFLEETGIEPQGPLIPLGEVKQAGGKIVAAWAFEGDCTGPVRSNRFTMEWPPRSGKMREFVEVDRAEWFSLEEANRRINAAQTAFLDRLRERLEGQ
jgi:predicted NUDIX family NTP pyrophosphohydrolase